MYVGLHLTNPRVTYSSIMAMVLVLFSSRYVRSISWPNTSSRQLSSCDASMKCQCFSRTETLPCRLKGTAQGTLQAVHAHVSLDWISKAGRAGLDLQPPPIPPAALPPCLRDWRSVKRHVGRS